MTGPRSILVRPHRTRARPLLPFLAAIMLTSLACSEQPGITESSNPGVAASTRLHPYVMNKAARSPGASFAQAVRSSALVSLGGASGSSARVLLIADEDGASTTALANSLADAGFLVNVRPAPEYTWDGTNPALDGFDLVLHLNGNTFMEGQVLSATAQSALVDFVRAGGGYIGSQWNSYEATDQQAVMQDLVLAGFPGPVEENCASCPITYSIVAGHQDHPLVAGIPSSFTFEADGHLGGPLVEFATEPATAVMALPSGTPGVLYRNLGAGKVVNFSFAPNYSLAGDGRTLRDANVLQLYVNAVGWAARAATGETKIPATITLGNPVTTFDGTAKSVTATTNPLGLSGVTVSYSQAGVPVSAPVNTGVYEVLATLDNEDYEAPQATGTLTIGQASPVIQWSPPSTMTAGTTLTSTVLNASSVGVNGAALTGEFVYLPGPGFVLAAGTQPLSVEFIPFDENYRSGIKTVTVTVLQPSSDLTFRGFYMPVRNLPVRNVMKAGRSVVVKFSVAGAQRAAALQSGYPVSRNVPCVAGVPERSVESTGDARRNHLEVNRYRGEYRFTWKTNTDWTGTCRVFEVKLVDGSTHEALFHFPRSQQARGARRHSNRGDRDDDD